MNLRKLMSLGAAAATLLGVLAGTAATASASSKVTLTWWTWTTNPQKVIANFEKAYPNITIKMPPSYGSGGTFYAKLTTAMAGGTGPDVTQVEFDHLPQFIGAKDLVNIAQYVSTVQERLPVLDVEPGIRRQRCLCRARGHRADGPHVPAGRAEEVQPPGARHVGSVRIGRGGAA